MSKCNNVHYFLANFKFNDMSMWRWSLYVQQNVGKVATKRQRLYMFLPLSGNQQMWASVVFRVLILSRKCSKPENPHHLSQNLQVSDLGNKFKGKPRRGRPRGSALGLPWLGFPLNLYHGLKLASSGLDDKSSEWLPIRWYEQNYLFCQ